jgi:hypothetical protein
MKEKLNLNPQNQKGKSRSDERMHFFQPFRTIKKIKVWFCCCDG